MMYGKLKELFALLYKDKGDRINQETLYDLQEKFGDLILAVANAEGKTDDLVKSFPFAFEVEK